MKTIYGLRSMEPMTEPVVLTVGTFDGVHLGHQAVVSRVVSRARASGWRSAVVTFDPHPRIVLGRHEKGRLLSSTAHKLQLIEVLGIECCVVVRFDRSFAELDAGTFVEELLAVKFDLRAVVAGATNRFGKNGSGDAGFLRQCARRLGFEVEVIEPVEVDGTVVTSTVVRRLVTSGELEQAAVFLGRPFSLLGTVVRGATRGRRVGYPTANLDPHNEVVPPSGVYAVRVRLSDRTFNGVLNIGFRPTFAEPNELVQAVEVHILDFSEPIYGREVEVFFVKKLREEHRFESVSLLRAQIRKDERETRQLLGPLAPELARPCAQRDDP